MRTIDRRHAWNAAGIAIAGALAAGAAIGIMSVAGERAAWAQSGPGSASACRPGVRAGSISPNGNKGLLEVGAHQLRLCGERGRLTYTMGGAPHVFEFTSTLAIFPPPMIDNPNNWHDWYLYDNLCDAVPSASDLPGAKLTVRLISYMSTTDIATTITLSPDTEKPTLKTTSTPPKGTKVKPDDTIKVRMEASEEYGDSRKGWQTGVKKLQLIDEGPNPVVTPHFENTGGPRPCAEKQWKQFLEVTYTVPPNPPPIIRLRAIAEDFAGNKDDVVAEFPTGDWHGTIKKTAKGGGHNHTIDIDYSFGIEASGTLKGRARARIRTEGGGLPGCTMLWTYSPSEFDIPLSGRRDGEKFEIALEPGTTTATVTSIAGACVGGGGQPSNTFPSHLNPAVYGGTKYQISVRDGATNTVESNSGALPWGVNMRDTIEIHRARQ